VNDEQLQQRIRYLIEHGGLYDDPIADVRRWTRVASAMASLAMVLHLVDLILR
jgi:hypothetical protein